MRKIAISWCGVILCSSTFLAAQPAEKEKVICVVEPNCVTDTIEVTFDGLTQSVLEYATVPVESIKVTIVTEVKSGDPTADPPKGVQGWSYGIFHDVGALNLTRADITGTDAQAQMSGGFDATSLKDIQTCAAVPCTTDNRTDGGGWISAVVLSFTQPIVMPLGRKTISSADYTLTKDVGEVGTVIEISNRLAKKNSPATDINVTVDGASKKWKTGIDGWIKSVPVPEDCDNGIDDDADGKVDCSDLDCCGQGTCPASTEESAAAGNCADGNDNDCDGIIDLDPECGVTPEICNNGIDDDSDGKTDCNDSECCGQGTCPASTEESAAAGNCADGSDNDCDGLVDDADPDCPVEPGLNLVMGAAGATSEGGKNVLKVCQEDLPKTIEAVGSIAPVGTPAAEGAAGWSISVEHDPLVCDIQNGDGFPTTTGTDAAALFSGGFEKTEVVDPARNAGRAGFVSAMVLSFTEAIALDPTKSQSIVRAKYTVKAGAALPSTIIYADGLRGVGQPVQNVITVKGDSVFAKAFVGLEIQEKSPADCGAPVPEPFIRGDANDDAKVNIADPIWIINELVRQGPVTMCKKTADANDDGLVDLSDAMYLIQWRFLAGPAPKAPFPACGEDPTADDLACETGSYTHCP